MTIGITGHQYLGDNSTIDWLNDQVIQHIEGLDISEAYSSLAVGADQLFANIILNLGISLVGIIPSEKYIETFESGHKKDYNYLYAKCHRIEQLKFSAPSELAFLAAGKRITEYSDMLIAIWNGEPAKGLGGTADIVKYAKSLNKSIFHINPISKIAYPISKNR